MLTLDQLKQALHRKGMTKTDAALLCVAAAGGKGASTASVKKLAIEAGFKAAKSTHFSAHLDSAEDKCFRTPGGWELTDAGKKHIAGLAAATLSVSPAAAQAQELRALLPSLNSDDVRAFLTEAIVCAEQSLFRAAVVLSWVGAVAILQDVVVTKHLAAFNAEATKLDPKKWKAAKTADDLGVMKEVRFLEILQTIGVLPKNIKQELDACLKLRNGCGHPNSLKIGPNKVAAHLETLAQNVYSVFG